jgi:hypothetical protein
MSIYMIPAYFCNQVGSLSSVLSVVVMETCDRERENWINSQTMSICLLARRGFRLVVHVAGANRRHLVAGQRTLDLRLAGR